MILLLLHRHILNPLLLLLLTTTPLTSSFINPSPSLQSYHHHHHHPPLSPLHSTSTSTPPTTTTITDNNISNQAIIIGGGPVGLATALILANTPHNYDVTLYESTSGSSSTTKYDATKAYLYNVNSRGQALLKERLSHTSIMEKLKERGVEASGMRLGNGLVVVPADVKRDIPPPRGAMTTTTTTAAVAAAAAGSKGTDDDDDDDGESSYWIPRHKLVEIFHEVIEEYEKTRMKEGTSSSSSMGGGRIKLMNGAECIKLTPLETNNKGGGGGGIEVTVKDKLRNVVLTKTAALVIGADGINSKVRTLLATDVKSFSPWSLDHSKFKPQQWISPSTDLRIKVLQFPPQFNLTTSTNNQQQQQQTTTHSKTAFAIRSLPTGPKTYLSLGLLPMTDNTAIRPANTITRPDHVIWSLNDGPSLRRWFLDSFPRVPFETMISDEEWERFASAEGTRFPPCQQCTGLAAISSSSSSSSSGCCCGVALVGDAIHAFPPDIGQGVNAGLEDVLCLDDKLRETKKKGMLGEALMEYERERAPQVKALIRLARFGSPYQYKQPHRIDRLRRYLWTINFIIRLLLNKLSFGKIPPAAILLAFQKPKLSFKDVMFRADCVTAALTVVGASVAGRILVRLLLGMLGR